MSRGKINAPCLVDLGPVAQSMVSVNIVIRGDWL